MARILAALLLISAGSEAVGSPAAPPSEHPVTCVLDRTELEIKGNGKKSITRARIEYAVQARGEAVEALRQVTLPWTSSTTATREVRVEVRNMRGIRLSRRKSDFSVYPYLEDGMFVSDTKVISLDLPPLEPGDTLAVSYEIEATPFLGVPPHVFGASGMPYETVMFRVVVPTDLDPRYRSWNGAGEPLVERSDGKTAWTWSIQEIGFRPQETYGPPDEDLFPVVSIGVNKTAWGAANAWAELGGGYLEYVREQMERDNPIPRESLLGGDSTDTLAPSARCLDYVQKHMRYVGILLGYSGYKPSNPEEIYRRKYGDCKDMSMLLLSALRSVNVGASLALVCTRPPAGYSTDPLPNLAYFNHAVVLSDAGEWLDATDHAGTETIPREDIQGAPALVLSGPHAGFQRIPMTAAAENVLGRTVRLDQHEDGTWRGAVTVTLTGRWAHQVYLGVADRKTAEVFRPYLSAGLGVDAVPEDAVSVDNRSRDSLVLTCSVPVDNPVAAGSFTPPWDPGAFPFGLFDSRSRETDVYWPGLFLRTDSLVVHVRDGSFQVADSTWSGEVTGMRVELARTRIPGGMTLSRSVSTTAPVLPISEWDRARRICRQSTRWVTRSFPVAGS